MRAVISALAILIVGGSIYFGLCLASWLLTQFVNANAWWFGPLVYVALFGAIIYGIGKLFDKVGN